MLSKLIRLLKQLEEDEEVNKLVKTLDGVPYIILETSSANSELTPTFKRLARVTRYLVYKVIRPRHGIPNEVILNIMKQNGFEITPFTTSDGYWKTIMIQTKKGIIIYG